MLLVFLFRVQAILFYVHIFVHKNSKLYLSILTFRVQKQKYKLFFSFKIKKKSYPVKRSPAEPAAGTAGGWGRERRGGAESRGM